MGLVLRLLLLPPRIRVSLFCFCDRDRVPFASLKKTAILRMVLVASDSLDARVHTVWQILGLVEGTQDEGQSRSFSITDEQ